MIIKLDEAEISEAIHEYLTERLDRRYPMGINWFHLNQKERSIEAEILFDEEKSANG